MSSRKSFALSNAYYERALKTVPLGSQTFSKSAMNFVAGGCPLFLDRGRGCRVWDVDGNEYIDFILGLLPVVLGYCDPDVDRAIHEQLAKGISFSLATTLEFQLAEELGRLIPCAEMVRFGKNGSDATTAAIRLARAVTGRDHVVLCGYHGWHDWYIGTTSRNLGVPSAVKSLSVSIPFNDPEAFERLLKSSRDHFAAIILEPAGVMDPAPGFLERLRELCDTHGTLLIFDEIVTGFRIDLGGAQKKYGVTPDLACFGKAMGNGMPISAVVGRRQYMRAMEDIFFSGTFGGEALSLAAALATLDKLERIDATSRFAHISSRLRIGVRAALSACGLESYIQITDSTWWPVVSVKKHEKASEAILTSLLRQELAEAGILFASSLNLSIAHDDESVIEQAIGGWMRAAESLAEALASPSPAERLRGKPIQAIFQVRRAPT